MNEAKAALTAFGYCHVLQLVNKTFNWYFAFPIFAIICVTLPSFPLYSSTSRSRLRAVFMLMTFRSLYCQILVVISRTLRCGNPDRREGEDFRCLSQFKRSAVISLVPAGLAVSQPTFVIAG
jgi:hypothetical protein